MWSQMFKTSWRKRTEEKKFNPNIPFGVSHYTGGHFKTFKLRVMQQRERYLINIILGISTLWRNFGSVFFLYLVKHLLFKVELLEKHLLLRSVISSWCEITKVLPWEHPLPPSMSHPQMYSMVDSELHSPLGRKVDELTLERPLKRKKITELHCGMCSPIFLPSSAHVLSSSQLVHSETSFSYFVLYCGFVSERGETWTQRKKE